MQERSVSIDGKQPTALGSGQNPIEQGAHIRCPRPSSTCFAQGIGFPTLDEGAVPARRRTAMPRLESFNLRKVADLPEGPSAGGRAVVERLDF